MMSKYLRVHHVEFYVKNAESSSQIFIDKFGFQNVGFIDNSHVGDKKRSYLLQQGDAKLMISSPSSKESPLTNELLNHGEGVKDIALCVPNLSELVNKMRIKSKTRKSTVNRRNSSEYVDIHEIKTYGDTIHTLIDTKNDKDMELLDWNSVDLNRPNFGIKTMDHYVANVFKGEVNIWADFYRRTLEFRDYFHIESDDISTGSTSMRSRVMKNGEILFNFNEPAESLEPSQIDLFLESYKGQGIQHIALSTDNIVKTVQSLREAGIEFIDVPKSYYQENSSRINDIGEDLSTLRELGIMADTEGSGYLLQTFTKPIFDRPTFFFEIIQRMGATKFGAGNAKALFRAVEEHMKKRQDHGPR